MVTPPSISLDSVLVRHGEKKLISLYPAIYAPSPNPSFMIIVLANIQTLIPEVFAWGTSGERDAYMISILWFYHFVNPFLCDFGNLKHQENV